MRDVPQQLPPPPPPPRDLPLRSPREYFEELDRYVVGQQRAKRVMALAAYNHVKRVSQAARGRTLLQKSNVMLMGPTGCGKTHLARCMARMIGLPFIVADATEYTEAGYYGKDVEVMVAELLHACDHSVAACERGVVFVDEIDKVARRSGGMRTGAGARDIGGEGVQQALLKLLEGRRIFVPLNVTQHWNKHDFVEVDTTHILFILAGTFTDARESDPAPIGFEKPAERRQARRVGYRQIVEYGMLPELMGRVPVIVQLDELRRDELIRIMTDPPDSVLKEYRELLAVDDVELIVDDEALGAAADFALARRVGARGLRAIWEEVLHDAMFDAPETPGATVSVDAAYVRERLEKFDSGMLEG